ncbi:hypothetical protein D046_5492B, partial [Vibrio parahaemolyticus V-223/04]
TVNLVTFCCQHQNWQHVIGVA